MSGEPKVGDGAAQRVFLQAFNPVRDHQSIADLSSLVTPDKPKEARLLIVQNTGTELIHYTLQRLSAPTATTGFTLAVEMLEPLIIPCEGKDFQFKAIENSAGAFLELQWAQ